MDKPATSYSGCLSHRQPPACEMELLPHLAGKTGRPRVADTMHYIPREHAWLAERFDFDEEFTPRLPNASVFGWMSSELADSDTWKCNNGLYVLNHRSSSMALAPQVMDSSGYPPRMHDASCQSPDPRQPGGRPQRNRTQSKSRKKAGSCFRCTCSITEPPAIGSAAPCLGTGPLCLVSRTPHESRPHQHRSLLRL